MTGGGYLNGSGYPDPTAYRAIKRMEDKEMEARSGELWRYAAEQDSKRAGRWSTGRGGKA